VSPCGAITPEGLFRDPVATQSPPRDALDLPGRGLSHLLHNPNTYSNGPLSRAGAATQSPLYSPRP